MDPTAVIDNFLAIIEEGLDYILLRENQEQHDPDLDQCIIDASSEAKFHYDLYNYWLQNGGFQARNHQEYTEELPQFSRLSETAGMLEGIL